MKSQQVAFPLIFLFVKQGYKTVYQNYLGALNEAVHILISESFPFSQHWLSPWTKSDFLGSNQALPRSNAMTLGH